MNLKPKQFKYKGKFKLRVTNTSMRSSFSFGHIGLLLMTNVFITSNQLFKIKLFLKKINKKAEKTKRRVWIKTFPFMPLSKKPQGLRMGKGVGKLRTWFAKTMSGAILIETKGVRPGRAAFFFKQMSYKLFNRSRLVLDKKWSLNSFKIKKFII